MATETIAIEVVCAEAERQTVIPLIVADGCTAADAIRRSGIFALHPGLDPEACGVGIFGREVARDRKLRAGDRVEVLRPLADDPRERRRRLARRGGSMGRRSA
ncbi:MAG TPA: RnfH family protein [Steroidobacteraceae bacterium]